MKKYVLRSLTTLIQLTIKLRYGKDTLTQEAKTSFTPVQRPQFSTNENSNIVK